MRTTIFAFAFAAALAVFAAEGAHASPNMQAALVSASGSGDGACAARSHGRGARNTHACGAERLLRRCEVDVRAAARRFARAERRHGHTARCS